VQGFYNFFTLWPRWVYTPSLSCRLYGRFVLSSFKERSLSNVYPHVPAR
jgi:hypothetical protein